MKNHTASVPTSPMASPRAVGVRTPLRNPLSVIPALLLLTLLTPAFGQAGSGETTDLRPIWRDGQTSRYRINQTERSRNSITGLPREQEMETLTEIEAEVSWAVIDADANGGGTARMTIENLSMNLTGPDGQTTTITANRGGDGTENLQQWVGALTGSPLEITVRPDGAIGRVSGHRAIQQRAGEMGANLDEDYFREIALDLAVLVGGKENVRPGDTWSHQHTGSHRMGEIRYDSTYTFQGVEQTAGIPIALIRRTADLDLQPDLSDLPPNAPDIDVQIIEAGQTAQLIFDLSRHEVVGGNSEQTLEVQLSFSAADRNLTQTTRESTNTRILRIAEE